MAKDIKDAVKDLSKGKGSSLRIGSRSVPHRLKNEERKLLNLSLKRGYLELQPWHRENLRNIYLKTCASLSIPAILCIHDLKESKVLSITNLKISYTYKHSDFKTCTFLNKNDAKQHANLLRNHLDNLE